ncbi:transposase, IS605 OrfB family, central region [Lentzea albidocapillata]|uniref:Transposase, IS605 OrfB family, central region n=1 Tax=Lentzea albidocapillata TaxID=40571 RepID=A0A1W2DI15_9PSEU|nr:transposase, IS605 OrfB family, central region [Lentzea albidocapillata]
MVKLVVRVKLLPTPVQVAALAATLHACNEAAEYASRVAFERNVKSRNELQKLCYHDVKDRFGLSAQPAVRVVKKVVDAYTTLRASIRAGNLGAEKSRRRVKAESKPISFRRWAAQPFDDRCLSWRLDARTVSIWTTAGRVKDLRFACSPEQLTTLRAHRQGESDLLFCDGMWFLIATCEVPEPEVFEPADWIGVDRGITNLATTSDLDNFQGRRLQRYRRWHARKRAELQVRRTKSAHRRLKKRARREARHATHVNHKIAKDIVAVAARTGRGIALEELHGIRDRVRPHRHQRATQSSWPFHQLEQHITYKARRAGVPVLLVDARYTSQMCPRCKHTSRSDRPTRDRFCCRRCGLAGPADVVAAVNIRDRARRAWVLVNVPLPTVA